MKKIILTFILTLLFSGCGQEKVHPSPAYSPSSKPKKAPKQDLKTHGGGN